MALSKSSFTLAASGPSFAIYITETFRSRIHHIHIRDPSSVIMTKAHNAKLDYKLKCFFPQGGGEFFTDQAGGGNLEGKGLHGIRNGKGNRNDALEKKPSGISGWEMKREWCHALT